MRTLCKIRDLYRSIAEFEARFEERYELSLNAGMLLCSLEEKLSLTSGEVATLLGITYSNASKVIKEVEDKNLLNRKMGIKDKRQMYFSLSENGHQLLKDMSKNMVQLPIDLKRFMSQFANEDRGEK